MIDLLAMGKRIAELRGENLLSQEELAARLFLSRQAISNWELGKAAPSIDNVIELSKLFHVSFETILCLDAMPSFNPEDPFQGHERNYVIREVISGRLAVDMSVLLKEATLDERSLLIRALSEKKIRWDWSKHLGELTPEEIVELKKGGHE
jgi:transcriptional regulator with XRE-family HTH domain